MKQILTATLILFFLYSNGQLQVRLKKGLNLAAFQPINEKAAPSQEKTSTDMKDEIKKINFGMKAGWGLEQKKGR